MSTSLLIDIRKTLRSSSGQFELNLQFRSTSQRIVIFGPSGAGKSLLLKTIAGLEQPDEGVIELGDTCFFNSQSRINLAPQARKIAYLFQDYALFPHLTVRQNVSFALRTGWFNPSAKQRFAAVDYWLDAFELQHLADQYPAQLSGGQRQRTALARALVLEPRALLLDEPFAALDPDLRSQMRQELDALQRRLAVPMILITHDQQDAIALGEHLVCLRGGKIDAGQGGFCLPKN